MRKIIERILVFLIAIPAFFAIIFLLDHYNHLAFNIIVILFSAIGAVEISNMLRNKNINIPKIEAFILGALAPLAAALSVSFGFSGSIIEIFIVTGALWVVLSIGFTKKEKLETAITHLIGRISLIIYPGFFMHWLVNISGWGRSADIFLFLLIVFFSDSGAWLFGTLLGKNNKGLIPASPNKSIAGFIGGMAGSVLICFLALTFFKDLFPAFDMPIKAYLLCFSTGVVSILGDLAESAIKRSCDLKDSGNIMLGRGGILDSIDSISVAAPVFYILYSYLFIL